LHDVHNNRCVLRSTNTGKVTLKPFSPDFIEIDVLSSGRATEGIMAWRSRNGIRYYYQTTKVNGRPVNRYIGRGDDAEQVAAEVEERKASRNKTRLEILGAREQVTVADHLAKLSDEGTDLLLEACLRAQGYHRTAGHWRGARRAKSIRSFS
jgi:hypothetical protein